MSFFQSGLLRSQTIDAISQAWVGEQSVRTYFHAPNTGSRKSWTAGMRDVPATCARSGWSIQGSDANTGVKPTPSLTHAVSATMTVPLVGLCMLFELARGCCATNEEVCRVTLLGAEASAGCCRAKPVGPAGEVSCVGGWGSCSDL
ncbi:hypothetical protein BGY98DRAFT_354501 [Russula aff. rugulosa BPL654]|nr:hypothetical protein BGY98DRAFT_354501 [Russula aff. rugulosa BPL654]